MVVREEAQFDDLRSGDVLVCPIAGPAWSVLANCAASLVTTEAAFSRMPR